MEALGNELELALARVGEMTDSCYRAQEVEGVRSAFFFSCSTSLVKKA